MNIYVGNMPYSMSEDDLRNLFGTYGGVSSARLVMDRDTGRAKGFGFVEMDNAGEAQAAIEAINGTKQGASSWSTRRVPVRNVRVVKAAAAAVSAAAVASDPGTLRVSVNLKRRRWRKLHRCRFLFLSVSFCSNSFSPGRIWTSQLVNAVLRS